MVGLLLLQSMRPLGTFLALFEWMKMNSPIIGKLFKQNEVSFQETPFLVVRAFRSFEIVERFDSVFDCRNVQL